MNDGIAPVAPAETQPQGIETVAAQPKIETQVGGAALRAELPTPVLGDAHLQPLGTGTTAIAEQNKMNEAAQPPRHGFLGRLFHR